MCACVRACVRACVCVCVCGDQFQEAEREPGREGEWLEGYVLGCMGEKEEVTKLCLGTQ